MIDVNVRGLLHGISAALPLMQTQRHGQFVNVASIGAHAVSPTAAVYCATKYAELADSISGPVGREEMRTYRQVSIPASAVAEAIAYAIGQPSEVDVSEIIVRPTASAA